MSAETGSGLNSSFSVPGGAPIQRIEMPCDTRAV